MEECKKDNCCEDRNSCGHDTCQQENHCTIAEDILCLAKCAKHELLQEKIKKLLEEKMGEKLDKIAAIAVDALLVKMNHKKIEKHACEQYREDLMEAFKN